MTQLFNSAFRVLSDEGPVSLTREAFYFGMETALRTLHSTTGRAAQGESIYDRDWDVLIILDACRVDLLKEVAATDEYPFLRKMQTFQSLGSSSEEWMQRNFTAEYADEMANTAMVTANVYSEYELDHSQFALVDEVWNYGWDDDLGTTPPRPVTDRAIATMRDHEPDRMIVHYMQPHAPFLSDHIDHGRLAKDEAVSNWGGRDGPKPVWKEMRDGTYSREAVWAAYKETLEAVLDEMYVLLNNLDAESVVISADHGNALGEAFMYGHPTGINLDCLRTVPWVTTSARDTGGYTPTTEAQPDDVASEDVTDRLQSLGYYE